MPYGFCIYAYFFFDFCVFDMSLLLLNVTMRGVSNKHCLLSLFSFAMHLTFFLQKIGVSVMLNIEFYRIIN